MVEHRRIATAFGRGRDWGTFRADWLDHGLAHHPLQCERLAQQLVTSAYFSIHSFREVMEARMEIIFVADDHNVIGGLGHRFQLCLWFTTPREFSNENFVVSAGPKARTVQLRRLATAGLNFGCTSGTDGPRACLKCVCDRNNRVPRIKSASGRTTLKFFFM